MRMNKVRTSKLIEAVAMLETTLSENEMEIISDALQCYGRHPEDHSYDEEIDDIKRIAYAFDMCGYNRILPEYDILQSHQQASEPSG